MPNREAFGRLFDHCPFLVPIGWFVFGYLKLRSPQCLNSMWNDFFGRRGNQEVGMDGSRGRRTASGISFSRGGCIITLREQNHHDRSIRCCSRLGCSASLYAMNGTQETSTRTKIQKFS
ncbi:hypothetical protein OPV22_010581 [Ensete ventricosum]|uniref:Uncharacterized protein n=1 Tax=Ensete ventricosum TaxID=4639 RepID=A0AAV8RDE5_ENSVE|nr:hypothetical protein OPV22_010581 [Ensete ventricosum]